MRVIPGTNARSIAMTMAAQLSALHYTYSQVEMLLGNLDGAREFQQSSAHWHRTLESLRDDWTDPDPADENLRRAELADALAGGLG
jgi:hypothetical protein